MKEIKFVSMDPSLRNTAIVWGRIREDGQISPDGYELSQTSPRPKKARIAVATATVEDCERTMNTIGRVINRVQPNVIFAEVPSGSKSSAAMKSYGISCAFIAHAKQHASKLITVTPRELKLGTVNNEKASKKEMMAWAEEEFPGFLFERKSDGTMVEGRMEHVADAIGAAVAGLKKFVENHGG